MLAFYYKPDPASAYQSILAITNDISFGWLVRGMHRWGASVFIILLFFHMGRVFIYGAYKYPRELNWLIGVIILVMALAEGFTGYLLPWDQTAYWATVVGININATAPILGPFIADFLKGGAEIGGETLARFYSLHMLLIPGLLITLITLHMYLVTRMGVSSPPWSKEAAGRERIEVETRKRGLVEPRKRKRPTETARHEREREPRRLRSLQARRQEGRGSRLPGRHVPRHGDEPRRRRRDHRALSDLVPHLGRGSGRRRHSRPALRRGGRPGLDAVRAAARLVLLLPFYLLRIFKWPESVILGTIGIPTIALILLMVVPFIDRRRERRLLRRPVAMAARCSSSRHWGFSPTRVRLPRRAARAPRKRFPPGSRKANLVANAEDLLSTDPDVTTYGIAPGEGATLVQEGGELLVQAGCLNCHVYRGAGAQNLGAPDLTSEGSRQRGLMFQIEHLKAPATLTPGSLMPSFATLTDDQLTKLSVFLESSRE